MKKLLTISTFALLSVLFTQCATKKVADDGKAAGIDAAKVAEVKKKYTEADMLEGKTVWEAKCAKCHKLFEPESRTVAKWEAILPDMSLRSKLTQDQTAKVRAYILSHAKLG